MRTALFCTIVLIASAVPVLAQSAQGEFFDTYIAQLFDSPVFFGAVVGSGILFFGSAIAFVLYEKNRETRILQWGQDKDRETLVEMLGSPVASEAQQAFTYLRRHGDDNLVDSLIYTLQDQRRAGKINPYCIYLLEDWNAFTAIPVLKQISSGKSRTASIASRTLAILMARQDDEHSTAA